MIVGIRRSPIRTGHSAVANAIDESVEFTGASIHCYCVLPDHAHLLIEVGDRDVASIKRAATRVWWVNGGAGTPWQRSFYDRGIRSEQEYEETVRYILDNPVAAGLVQHWHNWPYLGGSIIGGDVAQ